MNIILKDNKISLIRHIIKYKQSGTDRFLPATDAEERDKILAHMGSQDCTVIDVDQSGNEWIEGMEFDSLEAAKAALIMGEAAYKRSIPVPVEQQLVDIQMALIELAGTLPAASE